MAERKRHNFKKYPAGRPGIFQTQVDMFRQYLWALKIPDGIRRTAHINTWSSVHQSTAFILRCLGYDLKLKLTGSKSRPEIAGVLVGRNDDYIPEFKRLLYSTIQWNLRHLLSEVIFVEWNPPDGRGLLSVDLARDFKSLRAYVVPPELHRKLSHDLPFNLLEYHAKNVGIRRARSPWIVATNADAMFAPDTVYNIVRNGLSKDFVWVTRRADINWKEPAGRRVRLLDCLNLRRLLSDIYFGTGEFLLAEKALWHKARGYDESLIRCRLNCDARGSAQMVALGAGIKRAGLVFHVAHATSNSERVQAHHGEVSPVEEDLPYQNGDDWGLGNCREVGLAERVWLLQE